MIYDAFDCPECGCQVIAQERKRLDSWQTMRIEEGIIIDDDEEVEEDIETVELNDLTESPEINQEETEEDEEDE